MTALASNSGVEIIAAANRHQEPEPQLLRLARQLQLRLHGTQTTTRCIQQEAEALNAGIVRLQAAHAAEAQRANAAEAAAKEHREEAVLLRSDEEMPSREQRRH